MRTLSVFAVACLFSVNAAAFEFTVGDLSQDSCAYASIQEALDAARALGGVNTVIVANTGSYTNQAVVVGDQTVLIEGGIDSCQGRHSAPHADLSGNGVDPVIRITPSTSTSQQVYLHGLHLHGGGMLGLFGSNGGGVYVTNNVALRIGNSEIDGNQAHSGGGVFVDADQGNPTLQLDPGTRISSNQATYYGGGVHLSGGGKLFMVADDVAVNNNRADDAGGGISAFNGVISVGNPDGLVARADATGASVSRNSAGAAGGGIYLYAGLASLDAHELIVDGNDAAFSGGGIEASGNARVFMARDYTFGPALQCPNWRECSRISNNRAGGGSSGTAGGAISLKAGAQAEIAQTIVRGNLAQDGSVAFADSSALKLEGALVSDNHAVDTVGHTGAQIRTQFLSATTPVSLRIAYSTFAHNIRTTTSGQAEPAIDVIAQQNTPISVFSSAFYDYYYPITTYSPYTIDCVVEGGGGDAYGSNTRLLANTAPGFNNFAAGDLRLRSESPFNDYCDASAFVAHYRDLVLTPRCHDDVRKGNVFGTCDVGAYESDHIFGTGLQ